MRDPQQRRRRWAGGATTLLLALALAGCGGDDAGDQTATGDSAQIAASKGAGPPGGGAPDSSSCPAPPMATNAVLGGTWANLLGWLSSEGVTFPDTTPNVAEAAVPLCGNGCAPTRVKLQSTAQTYCLTAPQAGASQQRIMGMMVLVDSFPGKQPIPPLPPGDTIFLFARGNPGVQSPATLAYRQGVNVAQFPGSAGWNFVYCVDGHNNTRPMAQWRTVPDTLDTQTAEGADAADALSDATEGEGPGGGTYGWLACANGCCQFYTPPPTAGGGGGPPAGVPPPFCVPKDTTAGG